MPKNHKIFDDFTDWKYVDGSFETLDYLAFSSNVYLDFSILLLYSPEREAASRALEMHVKKSPNFIKKNSYLILKNHRELTKKNKFYIIPCNGNLYDFFYQYLDIAAIQQLNAISMGKECTFYPVHLLVCSHVPKDLLEARCSVSTPFFPNKKTEKLDRFSKMRTLFQYCLFFGGVTLFIYFGFLNTNLI